MKIRLARKSDYKELMKLYNGFVDEDRYSKYDNDSFTKVIGSPTSYVYVLEDNEKLAGFITFSVRTVVRYPRPIAEIDEFYINPDHRGKGFGKKLVETVLDKAEKLGCYRIFVESAYKWKAAQKLYEKMGFTNYGYHFIKNLLRP